MPDKRTATEKLLWDTIGPPLYYSEECKLAVKVTPVPGHEPLIDRPCGDCKCQIIAPRRAHATGTGKVTGLAKLKVLSWKWTAILTGRCT